MLAIILSVLKIIGIILLIILSVFLVVLVLVLFVPIRYYADVNVPKKVFDDLDDLSDDEKISYLLENITFRAGFHYLFYLVRGKIDYPVLDSDGKPLPKELPKFIVKVLFFTIFPKKEKNDNENSDDEDIETEDIDEENNYENPETEGAVDEIINNENSETEGVVEEIINSDTDNKDKKSKQGKENIFDKIKSFISFVKAKLKDITYLLQNQQVAFKNIKYTISSFCDKINLIKKTLESKTFKRAFDTVKVQLLKLIKSIAPRKADIIMTFGTGDPASTAEVLGAFSVATAFLPGNIVISPCFDNMMIELKICIRGRITLIRILITAIVIYFNKDIRKVVKRFKKIFR